MALTSEADLQGAADSGELREGPSLDMKREVEGGDRGTTRLAIDLAAMAMEGGTIVIGVEEGPPVRLCPVALSGLQERVEQIARLRPDPPVRCHVRGIPSASDPRIGYVVIDIPTSDDGPHAVDGRFFARSGSTNALLTAAEVRRLMQAPEHEASIDDVLRDWSSQDPTQEEQRRQAHIWIVARPRSRDPELLARSIGARWHDWLWRELREGQRLQPGWAPDLASAHLLQRVPDGWVVSTMEQPGQPAEPLRENNQLELEIGEDGSLRLFCSRGTDTLDGHQVVMEIVIAGLIRRILEAAMAVGAATGFGGTWEVGVEVGDLAGAISYFRVQHWFNDAADMPRYPQNIYRRTWTGPLSETTVNEALGGLFGPLNRTLTDGKFVPPMPA